VRRRPVHRPSRCLFCGDLASDTRLVRQLHGLICEDCFGHIGKEFARPRNTPIFIPSEHCFACRRDARSRLLVAGVAAAICRTCYLRAKRGTAAVKVDRSIFPLKGALRRALERSRKARTRERRKYERLGRSFRALPPEGRKLPPGFKFHLHAQLPRGIGILFEQGLLSWRLQSHLDLVASRDRVRGRPVLRFPDGKSPIERLRAV
jgi:hypothetical protein